MFDSKHYVPILKWKRAEQGALKALEEKQKKDITPLIQFVMPKSKLQEQLEDVIKRFEEQLTEIPRKLIEVWGHAPIFVDVSLLFSTPLKAKALDVISRGGNKLGGIFIPVIHLTDDKRIKESAWSVARMTKNGLCVRLICSDFLDMAKLGQDISKLISSSSLGEKDIDLLVDIKETEENGNKYIKYLNLSQNIVNLPKWRTFIFASGSFPEDLSQCKLDEENLIPRVEWKSWNEQVSRKTLKRKPAFADYTIQHPIYKEALQFFPPTTSIKYTLNNEWIVMKGKKQKFEMYLANAKLLSGDSRFYGSDFSYGDKYIAEKAQHYDVYVINKKVGGTGSNETWIRAGISHHLAVAAHQVATRT